MVRLQDKQKKLKNENGSFMGLFKQGFLAFDDRGSVGVISDPEE